MNKISVLLVDDDEFCHFTIKRLLSSTDFEIHCVRDCATAIVKINEQNFDIYIFDYRIDMMNGLDLLNKVTMAITDAKLRIAKPVILLTGCSRQQIAIDAMHAGVSDLLHKDNLTKEALHRTIRNALDKHELQCIIKQHSADLEHINQKLKKRNIEVKNFYQSVSHELKTPLTSIKEYIAIVIEGIAGKINHKQTKYLNIALANAEQMTLYINDLIDSSKLDLGRFLINPSPNQLNDIINKVVSMMKITAQNKNIQINVFTDPTENVIIQVDETRIIQVLINLLSNAVKFTNESGCIYINTDIDDHDTITVSIKDTGCGIPTEELSNIFNRLYQIKNEKNRGERGLGLGLYICKELVELHHGKINVTSELNKGSNFTVILPKSISNAVNQATRG